MPELTAPLVLKNEEKRIVYGPVLIPDEPDTDDDVVTAEQIEEVAHKFVEEYGNIDLQHTLNNVGKMVESYILPMDLQVDEENIVPKGSWMLGVRVTDNDSWEACKDGRLGGFSIMAIEKAVWKSKESTAEKNAAQKRTTLADLQNGWIVNAVSLVDEPAVPKAKFIAIKSKAKKNLPEVTEETVQKAIQGSLEHRKQLVQRKVYETFDSEVTDSYVHSTLDDSVIVRIENYRTNERRLFQINYEIDQQGNVTFSGQPQEVTIQESIVPVEPESNSTITFSLNSQEETEINASEKSNDGIFSKIMKKFGFQSSEKAGRTISDANYNKLKAAKEVIDDLLSVAEKERQSNKSVKEGETEMEESQVKELIQKEMQPLNDKLDELTTTIKSALSPEGKEEGKNDEASKPTETQQDENVQAPVGKETEKEIKDGEQETVSKSEYDRVLEELENAKKNRPFSKRLAGQDDMVEKSTEKVKPDRDAFGFKIK